MDLFYGTSFEEQVRAFKKDLRLLAAKEGVDFKGKKIYIALMTESKDGLLVVGPPLREDDKFFQNKYSKYLIQTTTDFNIPNVVLTSCYLIPKDQVSKADVKNLSHMTDKLVDIFQPRLIVVLGEDAQFSFVKRKFILRDYHGKIITSHSGIDVVATYEMNYYLERSEFEDPSYKEYIRKSDWEKIAKLYKERTREFKRE